MKSADKRTKLECNIPSKVTQTQKNKGHMFFLTCGFQFQIFRWERMTCCNCGNQESERDHSWGTAVVRGMVRHSCCEERTSKRRALIGEETGRTTQKKRKKGRTNTKDAWRRHSDSLFYIYWKLHINCVCVCFWKSCTTWRNNVSHKSHELTKPPVPCTRKLYSSCWLGESKRSPPKQCSLVVALGWLPIFKGKALLLKTWCIWHRSWSHCLNLLWKSQP